MSILLSLYYWWRAVNSAGEMAEARLHGILKKSNARLYNSHDRIVFLYSSFFFCVCFFLSYEAYDMSLSTREILHRSKKYCHRPKCPDGRLNLHSRCFEIVVGAEVVFFFRVRSILKALNINTFDCNKNELERTQKQQHNHIDKV